MGREEGGMMKVFGEIWRKRREGKRKPHEHEIGECREMTRQEE